MRFKHQVKLFYIGKFSVTGRAVDRRDIYRLLLLVLRLRTVCCFQTVVRSKPLMTLFTFNQGISEVLNMSARLPDLWVHNDRRVQTDHIRLLLDKKLPPLAFNIVFQQNTEWTVIPAVRHSSINL